MTAAPRWLVVVEPGVRASELSRILRRHGVTHAYVVPENPMPDADPAAADVQTFSLGDHVMTHGDHDAVLFGAAKAAARSVIEVAEEAAGDALRHRGVSLPALAETAMVLSHLYPTLVAYDVLARLLTQERWAGLLAVRSRGFIGEVLDQLARQLGRESPRVARLRSTARALDTARSTYDALSPGWLDQLVVDARYRARTRSLPKLAAADARESYLFITSDVQPICWTTAVPVMRELAREARVLALTESAFHHNRAPAEGVELRTFTDMLSPVRLARVARVARRHSRHWLALAERLAAKPPADLAAERFAHGVRLMMQPIARLLEREVLWLECVQACCESLRPRALCVIPDFAPVTMAAIEVARRSGVPSVTVQNGLRIDNARTGPVLADFAAVHEDWTRRVFLTRSAIDPSRIVATGQPRWDTSFLPVDDGEARKQRIERELGLPSGTPYAVYLTQPLSRAVQQRVLAGLAHASAGFGDGLLVVKTHPRERKEPYEAIIDSLEWRGRRPVVTSSINLHDALRGARLVITCFSTGAMEAALLDVPVLLVNLTGDRLHTLFAEEGLALEAHDEERLVHCVRELFGSGSLRSELDHSRRAFLAQNTQLTDGGATRRVADLMRTARARLQRHAAAPPHVHCDAQRP